ncbi:MULTISPECIES: MFS transporter [Streptomyces]|uniref:MFS transporter n=1 Tax=Streptomyces lasalocidi TaxID=324833 RepID=A0A4U5WND1_STRLS|nr:MFS transporter [Streptomyces lasalocidi]TKT03687.1 MFS transporter [Streptomyces lasalocidi]
MTSSREYATKPPEDTPAISHNAGNLTRYLAAHGTSLLGDQIYFIALAWAAKDAAGPSGVGTALAAASLPRAVLMLLGGVISDRYGARKVMLGSNIARTILIGLSCLWAITQTPSLTALCIIAVAFGSVDGVFYPASSAMPALLIDSSKIPQANGLRQAAQQGALLLGGPLGGVALATGGLKAALIANGSALIISIACLLLTHTKEEAAGEVSTTKLSVLQQMTEGLRYTARNPLILHTILIITIAGFGFAGPANVGLPLLADNQGWNASGYGILTGALGAGALIGALAISAVKRIPRPGTTAMMMLIIQALCMAAAAITPHLALSAVLMAITGIGLSVASAITMSLVQLNTDIDHLGRVMSVMTLGMVGLVPLAYIICGWLVSATGVTTTFVVFALMEIGAAAIGVALPAVRSASFRGVS